MNLIARLITTALIAALALVAAPAQATDIVACEANSLLPGTCTPPRVPSPEPCPPDLALIVQEWQALAAEAVTQLEIEKGAHLATAAALDAANATIARRDARIQRLREKVAQLRERLRSR